MTLNRATIASLGLLCLLGSTSTNAAQAADTHCVVINEFHNRISAEGNTWQRAQLKTLSESIDACDELKLGLLLSHPMVGFQNDSKALDALSRSLLLLSDDAVDKPMLSMVIDHIEERQTLRNMLGKSQRQLRYRQQQINTLRGQINQLKNLEAQLEDKAREAIASETEAEVMSDDTIEPTPLEDGATPVDEAVPQEAPVSE